MSLILAPSNPVPVQINVGSSVRAVGGHFHLSWIDIQDIEIFGDGPGMTSVGILIHELVEQYHKQVLEAEYSAAHHTALVAEEEIIGARRIGEEKTFNAQIVSGGRGRPLVINKEKQLEFEYPNGTIIRERWVINNNNIVAVKRIDATLPPLT